MCPEEMVELSRFAELPVVESTDADCDSILVVLLNELSTDKTKEWMNYKLFIELIQNALSQSSEQGASLLFTCPTLTAVSQAMCSGGCLLLVAARYVISTR